MTNEPRQELHQFLTALYADGIPSNLLLWQKSGSVSWWFRDIGPFVDKALELRDDVYIGTCPRKNALGRHKRGDPSECSHLVALWLDIDWKHEVHSKAERLPATRQEAIGLAMSMPITPSAVVMSGHGIQPWWFLREPLALDSAQAMAEAEELSQRWAALGREIAAEKGWTMDSVFNLDRIMRIPGTNNCKEADNKIETYLISCDAGKRYDIEQLREYVQDVRVQRKPKQIAEQIQVSFDNDPALLLQVRDKIDIASENDTRFKSTWEMKRRDMAGKSASEYDLSLSSQMVAFGWTDQEITAGLILWRRKHQQPEKSKNGQMRADYYARTISRARSSRASENAMDIIAEYASDSEALQDSDTRRDALRQLSNLFGFRVDRIEKHVADEPTFEIYTELGGIQLGGIDSIMSQSSFRRRIAAATSRVMGKVKPDAWDDVAQVILNACQLVSIGPDATRHGRAQGWLGGYIEEFGVAKDSDDGMANRVPFFKDGRLVIFLASLRQWITTAGGGDKITAKELGQHLRSIGGEPCVMAYEQTTRNVWQFAQDITTTIISTNEQARKALQELVH